MTLTLTEYITSNHDSYWMPFGNTTTILYSVKFVHADDGDLRYTTVPLDESLAAERYRLCLRQRIMLEVFDCETFDQLTDPIQLAFVNKWYYDSMKMEPTGNFIDELQCLLNAK